MTEIEADTEIQFCLTVEEALALQEFLLTCGYISYEFHEDIHKLWARLDKFVKETLAN